MKVAVNIPPKKRVLRFKAREDVKPNIVFHNVTPETPICRFINFAKLLDLLAHSRLFLPSLKSLMNGDPFECSAPPMYAGSTRFDLENRAFDLRRFAPDSHEYEIIPELALSTATSNLKFKEWLAKLSEQQLRTALWWLERARLSTEMTCLCFHRMSFESDAMWKLYAAQHGAAIVTSGARLLDSLEICHVRRSIRSRYELHLAEVAYNNNQVSDTTYPFLQKRRAYRHEEEVRLYCDPCPHYWRENGVKVNLKSLIETIIISPFTSTWESKAIEVAITALLEKNGVTDVPIKRSEHMEMPQIQWPQITSLGLEALFGK